MFLGQLSGVGTGLLPQHLPVFRLGFVCFINALRWRTTSRLVSTSTGLMMEHEPPSKRKRSAEKKILKDESTIKGLDAGRESCLRDTSPPGTDLSGDFKSTHVTRTFKDQSESKDGVPRPHRGSEEESPGASSEETVVGTPPPEIEPVVRHAQGWKSLLPRRWEVSPVGAAARSPHVGGRRLDFSVMSYNLLSQDLLRANGYLYSGCPPAALSWRHRVHNLLAEMHHYDADVLCLQEVQEDHFENQIRPTLHAQGYECVYKKRTGKNTDGCAVAFKTSRFSLLSSNPVEYFRPGDALLDRDNVGLVLLLRPSGAAADDFVCVANTHLLYNPRRGDVKLAQLAILLAEIGRSARLSDGAPHPVLLCGDFNSTPWSPLFAFLTNGRLDYRHLPVGTVSGQENTSRGQRLLESPIWSPALGINQRCQYESTSASAASSSSAAAAEQESSQLTAKEVTQRAAADKSRKRWRLEHGVPLRSCYPPYLPPDGRGAVTTCHSRCAMMVDYILYTPCESLPGGRGLQLLGRLSLVGQSELNRVDRLPNARHSSDHLPLLARFRWMVGERS